MLKDLSLPVERFRSGFPGSFFFVLLPELFAEFFSGHALVLSAVLGIERILHLFDDVWVGFVLRVSDDSSFDADRLGMANMQIAW